MLTQAIKLIRVPQWIKNLFVFVPLIFSLNLFRSEYFLSTLLGFIIFCFTSSIVYILNDIIDAEADRAHPRKKDRPIASGKISPLQGILIALVLVIIVIILCYGLSSSFIMLIVLYFLINILYSLKLKHMVLLDIFSIAAGFLIRVLAGAVIIHVAVSSWLILTTMFISLFLAVMKRHSELVLVTEDSDLSTRKVLAFYSVNFADQIATVAAAGVIICYALYTLAERTISVFQTENLIYTTPFVVFGIFRYMFLVYMNKRGENTTQILISDIPMIITVVLYVLTTLLIIYYHI
ncbi:MAG TPA: decaprenyl-phosphate phosphoribosyltransferase [Ignavibacteriaceae bacterium]|nr:decaprenyl-phosphate phosphoribosyltransferase [Ignavibacteriaceae bacterium]